MQICLLGPPTIRNSGGSFPPLTLTHLATILDSHYQDSSVTVDVVDLQLKFSHGHLKMEDPDLLQKITDLIKPGKKDVLLITTMCNNLALSIHIADECKKENPEIKIVLGGVQATLVSEKIVWAFPFIDAVVRKEGDITLLEMLNTLLDNQPLDTVKGITFRNHSKITTTPDRPLMVNMDQLPFLNFNLVEPLDSYEPDLESGDYAAFIDVGRGCPHHCAFCSATLMWNGKVRQKSVSRLLLEMDTLFSKHGIRHFYFNQDEFTSHKKYLNELCTALQHHPVKYYWKVFARLDTLDMASIRMMVQAGCTGLFWGVESGSSERLKQLNKRVPHEKAIPFLRYLNQEGVEVISSLILGFPDETFTELNDTLNLALELALEGSQVNLQLLTPIPGTSIWNQYRDTISLYPEYYPFYDNSEFLGEKDYDIIAAHPEIFSVYFNYEPEHLSFDTLFGIYNDYRSALNLYPELIRSVMVKEKKSLTDIHQAYLDQKDRQVIDFQRYLEDIS